MALYVIYTLASQVIAVKIASFELGFVSLVAPAAVLIFPFTFQLTDIVNEKFGRSETHKMIFIAFITQVFMVFFFWVGTRLSPAPFWELQDFWGQIFGLVPRITIASWIAFLASENLDAWLYATIKRLTGGRLLWVRNIFSDVPSIGLDSVLFVTIAFYGVLPLPPLILGQLVIKLFMGVIDTPLMYLSRWIMKEDTGDRSSQPQASALNGGPAGFGE